MALKTEKRRFVPAICTCGTPGTHRIQRSAEPDVWLCSPCHHRWLNPPAQNDAEAPLEPVGALESARLDAEYQAVTASEESFPPLPGGRVVFDPSRMRV